MSLVGPVLWVCLFVFCFSLGFGFCLLVFAWCVLVLILVCVFLYVGLAGCWGLGVVCCGVVCGFVWSVR